MSFEKATIAGLIAFINRQPAARTMDHCDWCGCAVGHFAVEELGIQPEPSGDWAWDVAEKLYREGGSSRYDVISYFRTQDVPIRWKLYPSVMDMLDNNEFHNGATYGQLRTVMAEKFPDLGFGQKPPVVMGKPAWFTDWSEKKFAELTAG